MRISKERYRIWARRYQAVAFTPARCKVVPLCENVCVRLPLDVGRDVHLKLGCCSISCLECLLAPWWFPYPVPAGQFCTISTMPVLPDSHLPIEKIFILRHSDERLSSHHLYLIYPLSSLDKDDHYDNDGRVKLGVSLHIVDFLVALSVVLLFSPGVVSSVVCNFVVLFPSCCCLRVRLSLYMVVFVFGFCRAAFFHCQWPYGILSGRLDMPAVPFAGDKSSSLLLVCRSQQIGRLFVCACVYRLLMSVCTHIVDSSVNN